MKAWLGCTERWLAAAENFFAILSIVTILCLSLGEIAARNFLHTGIPGADLAIRHLVLWVCFLGAVLAVAEGRHVKIDVAVMWIPQRWQAILAVPFNVFAALVCGFMALGGWHFWREEWAVAPTDEQWVAALMVILPLGFCLLALHFLLRALLGQHPQSPAS